MMSSSLHERSSTAQNQGKLLRSRSDTEIHEKALNDSGILIESPFRIGFESDRRISSVITSIKSNSIEYWNSGISSVGMMEIIVIIIIWIQFTTGINGNSSNVASFGSSCAASCKSYFHRLRLH
jgi:hypothetical protein